MERHAYLARLYFQARDPADLASAFLVAPLRQTRYSEGFGTLFTAEYDPKRGSLSLHWPGLAWHQGLDTFSEGSRTIRYASAKVPEPVDWLAHFGHGMRAGHPKALYEWIAAARADGPDWAAFGALFDPRIPHSEDTLPDRSGTNGWTTGWKAGTLTE
jgi:hypothetical protein